MNNFSYANPTRIQFGKGEIAALSTLLGPSETILLVYGGGSIKHNGVYDQVMTALKGRMVVEFSGVEPNPSVETLDNAVALGRAKNATFILAVGGGSVIDGCKYIAAAMAYSGDGWDILTGKHVVSQALPLGAVLTIPATGSESNAGAVISRRATHEKCAFHSPAVMPRFAIMDPDVILSLPERQVANGLVDAFVHVCEQYITTQAGAMVQDGYAEALLRTLASLTADVANRQDENWRANFMWAANQALNGLIGVGVPRDFATHMLGHELTALFGIDHARTLAVVQPSLLRSQMAVKKGKLEQMGRTVFDLPDGPDLAERTIQAIEALYHSLNVGTRLRDYADNGAPVADGPEFQKALDALEAQLREHGQTALGEHGTITLAVSRAIYIAAL